MENEPMRARKGRSLAPDRAFQNWPKGIRQKMNRKMARVRPTGTIITQWLLGWEISSAEGGSGTHGSLTASLPEGEQPDQGLHSPK
jgi:hypothetical protein